MYDDAKAQKNEYCAIITAEGIHSWKTEDPDSGEGFGPFSPKWDSTKNQWYLTTNVGVKQYIIGVVHVHWDPKYPDFSILSDEDAGFATRLHGAPLFLFNAQGEVKAIKSKNGNDCFEWILPSTYTVKSLTGCDKSLINLIKANQ